MMREKPGLNHYQKLYSSELQKKLHTQGLGLTEAGEREAFVAGLKVILQEGREEIKEAHLSGARGDEVVYRITAWADAVLMGLFDAGRILSGLKDKEVRCALLAIGGYGRGELNPHSDLDVMFLTEREIDADSRRLAENCLYLMWDLNLDVGHSIRTVSDCVALAASDIKAKTSLIESRMLAGNGDVYSAYLGEYRNKILHRGRDVYLRIKISDVNERNKKYGGSIYLKEPHIKEGVGGLRDIHTAFWIAKVKYGVNSLGELKQKGVISEKEDKILRHSLRFLWKVRNHLHYLSGRQNDTLTMDKQVELAHFFRYKDYKHYLAVERFMRAYYLQTRNVRYFTSLLMSRCLPSKKRTLFPLISFRKKTVGTGMAIVGGALCVPDDHKGFFREEPERLMEIFYLSQRYDVPLADSTREKVLSSLGLVNDAFRSSDRVRDLFFRILRHEKDVVKTLREMHELRLLGKYIPEFGALTALVQHELYHTYTVDEHSLFALEKLEHLLGRHYPHEYFYSQLFQEIQKPEILYFSLLLHDIGKAMGPGHVKRGSRSVPSITVRMGLSSEDTQTVEFLLENHLVMGHLSQRRDIHDPKLIGELARTVGDEEHLRMLALVTYCDTNAVGPGVWNEWKDTLLKELFAKTREYLRTGLEQDVDRDLESDIKRIRDRILKEGADLFGEEKTIEALKSLPDNYLLSTPQTRVIEHISMIQKLEEEGFVLEWTHPASLGYTELNLCTYDSDTPGLFSRIAGVLASRGINILGARIFTSREGVVIDCVHVEPPDEKKRSDPAFWGQITEDIYSVIERTGQVEKMLVVHEPPSYLKKKKGHKIPSRVHVDNSVSDTFTVIDVYAEDRIGLLYSITSCLADQGVYIHSSKITTEADKAIDAFYVTDIFGHKITEKGKLQLIKNALLEALKTPEINGKSE